MSAMSGGGALPKRLKNMKYISFDCGEEGTADMPQIRQGANGGLQLQIEAGANNNQGVSLRAPYFMNAANDKCLLRETDDGSGLDVCKAVDVSVATSGGLVHPVVLQSTAGGNVARLLPTPGPIYKGFQVTVKRMTGGANTLGITASGGSTIDGAASVTLVNQWASVTFICDGTNWTVLNRYLT